MEAPKSVSRKEKRKALKKEKRKQIRKELAEKARAEEEARLNDPEELRKIEIQEQIEKELLDKQRKEFEEREIIFLQTKKKEQQEEEHAAEFESNPKQEGAEESLDDDNEWEYVEEGPSEIIWQGNEIIVKKNKVRVKKKQTTHDVEKEDSNRPTSNPLPPQSEAYAAHKNAPMTSTELLDTVAQQFPNFGTEQDKSHCPFHIKTGACRFGLRCNRVHYYLDKSTTLLIKNMYNGPGLAWEQDEGLEYTDEEVERSYEDFYEDVHTEFLKFGEIINFKVCRNGSFHLRGNVYVHYKSLDSALMAYNSVNGRYFAGKQATCEFVSLTRWKIAICGEYMKSRLKTCSRGSACNFLHCFSNPGGDYEWADFDKPPPRFWVKKMIALFGYSDELSHDKQIEQPSPKDQQHSSRIFTSDSYHNQRHRSLETNQHNGSSSRSHREESYVRKSRRHERQKEETSYEDNTEYKSDIDSVGDQFDRRHREKRSRRNNRRESRSNGRSRRTSHGSSSDEDLDTIRRQDHTRWKSRHSKKVLESSNGDEESDDAKHKPDEMELQRYKEKKTNSSRHHTRSKRQNHDDEPSAKKRKREETKPATDTHSRRRHDRSRSRDYDSTYFLGKTNTNDRWEPDTSPSERKPKVRRSSRETHSRSVEDESKNSQDVGKTPREKR